jgi:hypothetical protein
MKLRWIGATITIFALVGAANAAEHAGQRAHKHHRAAIHKHHPATIHQRAATAAPVGQAPQSQLAFVPFSPFCDQSLWDHVYHPNRLIQHGCVSVTGIIVDASHGRYRDGVRHEGYGDTHGWLKLDPQYSNLLNDGNQTYQGGNLVFEIVCYYPVKQQDAKAACRQYESNVTLPPVGTHVRITGTYVQDTNHGHWMEIHPVTEIWTE